MKKEISNMKKITFYYVLTMLFLSCNYKSKEKTSSITNSKSTIEVIQEREQLSIHKNYSEIGQLISTIEFRVRTNNKKDFEDGFIPWADLANSEQDLPNLDKKDDIVINEKQIKILIDYPLTNQYQFILKSDKGFSRGQLLMEIRKHYYLLYEEEEKTATIKTIPKDKRTTMYNRNETNGKYGIWGHDIADLAISKFSVYKAKNGEIVVVLNIES